LCTSLIHDLETQVETGGVSQVDDFQRLSQSALRTYREQARGPSKEEFQKKLTENIGLQITLFIAKNNVDLLQAEVLRQQEQAAVAYAQAKELQSQISDIEKQRQVEMEILIQRIKAAEEQRDQEKADLERHNREVIAKMQAETQELLNKSMHEAAYHHQKELERLEKSNQASVDQMKEMHKAEAERNQRELNMMADQVKSAQDNLAAVKKQADDATTKAQQAAQNSGGGVRLICAVL